MRMSRVLSRALSVVIGAVSIGGIGAGGASAAELAVVAISSGDRQAVVREAGEESRVRTVGDELSGGRYVIRKILADRVVLEERGAEGRPAAEVWVYLADASGRSRIERVEAVAEPPERPEVTVPDSEGRAGAFEFEGMKEGREE